MAVPWSVISGSVTPTLEVAGDGGITAGGGRGSGLGGHCWKKTPRGRWPRTRETRRQALWTPRREAHCQGHAGKCGEAGAGRGGQEARPKGTLGHGGLWGDLGEMRTQGASSRSGLGGGVGQASV